MTVLENLLNEIYKISPLQKKSINKYISTKDILFFEEANYIIDEYVKAFSSKGISLTDIARGFVKFCNDTLAEQIKFSKTGKYSHSSFADTEAQIYQDRNIMLPFMLGIFVSQFLWPNHHQMYNFYKSCLKKINKHTKNYLEIGAGHGLLLHNAINQFKDTSFTVLDISSTSIELTKTITAYLHPTEKINYQTMDFLNYSNNDKFSFITMGEVLEHVEKPASFLAKIYNLLEDDGYSYITTCTNCPAIDHIYLYSNLEEIRAMITDNKLKIIEELYVEVDAVASLSNNKIQAHNYCALIQRDI